MFPVTGCDEVETCAAEEMNTLDKGLSYITFKVPSNPKILWLSTYINYLHRREESHPGPNLRSCLYAQKTKSVRWLLLPTSIAPAKGI